MLLNGTAGRLAVDVLGPDGGATVVLLHGGGQTRHSWRRSVDGFVQAGYRVINYDARGHGDSDWAPNGDYSLPALGADLCAVLEVAGNGVSLIGASMGGMTAFYVAGKFRPPGVRALVMVDIVPQPSLEGVDRVKSFMGAHPNGFATIEEAQGAVAAYSPERARPVGGPGLRRNLRLAKDGRLYWHWDPRLVNAHTEPPEFSNLMTSLAPNLKIPVLLVRGGKSDIVDDAGVNNMRTLVPQTKVYDVPDAGHMVVGDSNDPFVAGVIQFLKVSSPLAPERRSEPS